MDLRTKIGKIVFSNPIMVASGTFGNGEEFKDFVDLKKLGAIVTKTITLRARQGNRPPRIIETPSGMLNSIGLENGGVESFSKEILPSLKQIGTKIIVSIAGKTTEDYIKCVEKLNKGTRPDAIEANLSCPNVEHKGGKHSLFAQDAETTKRIIRRIKNKTNIPIIAKLTPNVTNISEIAKASEQAGADALALVNTYMGMAIDIDGQKPVLGNISGGLSGPAIKPLALKAVYDVYKAVKVPIIGMGGIMNAKDVVEFFLAGASAVQVGTANFIDPSCTMSILDDLKKYIKDKKIKSIGQLVGKAHR